MPEHGAENKHDEQSAGSGEVLSWKCHPSRRNPTKTLAVLALLVALMMFASWYTTSLFIGIVIMIVMILSLGAYFFPTWYTLDAEGVTVKTLATKFKRPWSMFRSHWVDRNGVLLSPFSHASRLENFRGLFVRYENNRDEVVAFVKRYVAEPEDA